MAIRYWVGGSGNWADTAKWSTTSGGTGGASVPDSSDDVIVNSSSGSPTISLQSTSVDCKTLTTTGATCSFTRTLLSSATLSVGGNITLSSGTTVSVPIDMENSGTFTRAGASFGSGSSIRFNGGSGDTYTIADSFSGRAITLSAGTLTLQAAITSATVITIDNDEPSVFNTGANNVTAEQLICNGGSRTLNMGSGTWTISTQWTVGSSATLNAETANINLTNGADFAGGGKSYNRVRFTSGGIYTITGSNSFTEMDSTSTVEFTVRFTAGTTNTFDSFTVQGFEEGEPATIESTSTTKANLVKPSFWFVRTGDSSITRCTGVYSVANQGLRYVNFTDINGQINEQASGSSFLQMFD